MPKTPTALAATSATTPTSSKSCSSSSTAPRPGSPGGGAPNCSPSSVLAAAWWRLDTWTTLTWAAIILAGLLAVAFGRAALPPVHHPARSGASWPGTASSGCATKPGCTPAPGGCRSSCGPGRPRSANAPGCCAARASAPRTSKPTSASCAPPATPATRGSPATAAGPTCVTIDIIRRDTLAASQLISSPLERLTAHYHIGQLELVPPMDSPRRGRARRVTRHGGPRLTPGAACPYPSKEAPAMTATDTRPLPPVPTFPFSMFDPVHLGVDEYGEHVYVNLAERNMLLGGEPGGGKSSAENLIVAHGALSYDCRLVLVDGNQVQLGPWRHSADMFIGPSTQRRHRRVHRIPADHEPPLRRAAGHRPPQDHPRGRRGRLPGRHRRVRLLLRHHRQEDTTGRTSPRWPAT